MNCQDRRGFTVWLTGLPCAGKSTLALLLQRELGLRGMPNAEILDGDFVRKYLSPGLGFSKADRDENILRIGWVCQLLAKHGVPNIVAAVSPYRETRNEVRCLVEQAGGSGSFIEVWVRCSVEECIQRDVKGLYAKALEGTVSQFTGISDPYEEPLTPDAVVDTDKEGAEECSRRILTVIGQRVAGRPRTSAD